MTDTPSATTQSNADIAQRVEDGTAKEGQLPAGYCAKCFEGYVIDGTPTGNIETLSKDMDIYISRPNSETTAGNQTGKGIIYFTDVFGYELNNHKIIPDLIAKQTGVTVYVPDILQGDALSPEMEMFPATPTGHLNVVSRTLIRTKAMLSALPKLPPTWPYKHRKAAATAVAQRSIDLIRAKYNLTDIAIIGFCFGGVQAVIAAANPTVRKAVIVHPAEVTTQDLEKITQPTAWHLASDLLFTPALEKVARETLSRRGVPHSFTTYPGTTHGFAGRPNLAIEDIRRAVQACHAAIMRDLSSF